jgi:hypothetical protein
VFHYTRSVLSYHLFFFHFLNRLRKLFSENLILKTYIFFLFLMYLCNSFFELVFVSLIISIFIHFFQLAAIIMHDLSELAQAAVLSCGTYLGKLLWDNLVSKWVIWVRALGPS